MNFLDDPTIPLPLWDALVASNEDYGEGVKEYMADQKGKDYSISVTALNKTPRQAHLQSRHSKEIFIDPIKDCWHSMMGNIIHWVLEKYASRRPHLIAERRVGCDIKVDGKTVHIHGQFDLYDKKRKCIQDWKLTSPSSMLYDKEDHRFQLNRLRYILIENGYEVKELENVYLFPHLDKTKFGNPAYPQRHAVTVKVPLMDLSEVYKGIKARVKEHMDASQLTDKELPRCSDSDRWIRENFWLAYTRKKGGRKGVTQPFRTTATKRVATKNELIRWRKAEGIKLEDIIYKQIKGHPTRCDYCKAAPFCNQLQEELIANERNKH
jgi:PD-(D/E)XK nuclease superfamily